MNPSNTKLPQLESSFMSPAHSGCKGKPHFRQTSLFKTHPGRGPDSQAQQMAVRTKRHHPQDSWVALPQGTPGHSLLKIGLAYNHRPSLDEYVAAVNHSIL